MSDILNKRLKLVACDDEEQEDFGEIEIINETPPVEEPPAPVVPEVRKYKLAFLNFLRDFRIVRHKVMLQQTENENLPFKEQQKIAGQRWRTMTIQEKEPYQREALYKQQLDESENPVPKKQQRRKRKICPKCGGYRSSPSPSPSRSPSPSASEPQSPENPTGENEAKPPENTASDGNYSSDTTSDCSICTSCANFRTDRKKIIGSNNTRRAIKLSKIACRKSKVETIPTSDSRSGSYWTRTSDSSDGSDTTQCSKKSISCSICTSVSV